MEIISVGVVGDRLTVKLFKWSWLRFIRVVLVKTYTKAYDYEYGYINAYWEDDATGKPLSREDYVNISNYSGGVV